VFLLNPPKESDTLPKDPISFEIVSRHLSWWDGESNLRRKYTSAKGGTRSSRHRNLYTLGLDLQVV
jgi:hypothetical protein